MFQTLTAESAVHILSPVCDLDNKNSSLMVVKDGGFSEMLVCQITADFFYIKPDQDVSLTLKVFYGGQVLTGYEIV